MAPSLSSHLRRIAHGVNANIEFPDSLASLPCLRAANGEYIPLFRVLEHFDGNLDLDAVARELPTLRFSQLTDTIQFVRRVLQSNDRGVDIDDIEDECLIEGGIETELRGALLASEHR